MAEPTIKSEAIDALAEKVSALLEPRLVEALEKRASADMPQLVDATTIAQMLGVSRATVYTRADELGAVRLGDGGKPRLRFDPDRAREAMGERDTGTLPTPHTAKRRVAPTSHAPLLPIKGRAA